MMTTKQSLIMAPLLWILMGGACFAADLTLADVDPELESLLKLDIGELLVNVASKRDEKIEKAPGIITVITAREIRSYGANNLNDLLSRLPNTFSFGSPFLVDSVTSIRGQTLTHIDNHVLILLNNRPMRESQTGGLNTAIYQNFPLEAIKRIEVIRGPGSVLYGSNAFSGAINIVTWDADELSDNSVTAGYGSYDTVQASGLFKASLEDFSFVGAGKYLETDGWGYNFTNLFTGNPDSVNLSRKTFGGFAQAKYKRLTLTGFSGTDNYPFYYGLVGLRGTSQMSFRRRFVDIQYDQPLGMNWQATLNFTYNGFDFLFDQPSLPLPVVVGSRIDEFNDILVESSVKGSLFDGKLNILAGFTFQRLRGVIDDSAAPSILNFANDWYNEYLQVDYSPWDFLKFIGGVQFNKVTGVPLNISPRVGAIVNFSPETGLKLLYGQAFRAAFASEKTLAGPVIFGDPDLKSEQIATFDAQIFYSTPKLHASLTYYSSSQSDTITESITNPFPLMVQIVNAGDVHYEGIELETKWNISPRWSFTGSVSYQENHDEMGLYDVGLIPNFMAKAGISYTSPKGISAGLFNSYYGKPASITAIAPVFPPSEDHNWLTFKGSLPLKAIIDRPGLPNLIFSIYGENLLNEDVHFPEFFTKTVNTFPLRSGVSVHGSATLKF